MLLQGGKGNTVVSDADFKRCRDEFLRIFTFDHDKSRYFGLTRKGQKRWLSWLENEFEPYAKQYRSSEGEPMMRLDVAIYTEYGKMNGYGYILTQLIKLGMKPFTMELDDVDFSVDAFINNIFEDDQTDSPEKPSNTDKTVLRTTPLVTSNYTATQLANTFANLRKSKSKNNTLVAILLQGLPGGGKTRLGKQLAKTLNQLGFKALYIDQDSLGREDFVKAIETCRNTETIAVIGRCHLGEDDKKIYLGAKGLRNGDRILKLAVGTNDDQTLLRSILGVTHRDNNELSENDVVSSFTYKNDDERERIRMLKTHRNLQTKWSDVAYPEEVFGTPYKVELFKTDPFENIDVTGSFDEIRDSFVLEGLLDDSGVMTQKMLDTLVPTSTLVNHIIASMVSPSTLWGTWKTGGDSQVGSPSQKKEKILYFCVKFDAGEVTDLLKEKKVDLSDFPENATFKSTTGEFHTTMWFCSSTSDDKVKTYLSDGMTALLGHEFDIQIRSFSRDASYARLDIELPDVLKPFYKNEAQSHVTLVHTGKAVDAGTFKATQVVPLDVTIRGKVMTAVQGNRMVSSLQL